METTKQPADAGSPPDELEKKLAEHEAGVADILDAYEIAEPAYFTAVEASAPHPPQTIASSSTWLPDADLG